MAESNHTISTISTGNPSQTTINELAFSIEILADAANSDESKRLPLSVNEGLLFGIQHLAQKLNQLTQIQETSKPIVGEKEEGFRRKSLEAKDHFSAEIKILGSEEG